MHCPDPLKWVHIYINHLCDTKAAKWIQFQRLQLNLIATETGKDHRLFINARRAVFRAAGMCTDLALFLLTVHAHA